MGSNGVQPITASTVHPTTNSSKSEQLHESFLPNSRLGHNTTYPILKKRKRGGRKRNKKKCRDISLYFVNINGYQSKKESLLQILEVVQPDIVALVETKLPKNKGYDDWKKYVCFKRNSSQGKGGVMCAFKKGTFQSARNVTLLLLL